MCIYNIYIVLLVVLRVDENIKHEFILQYTVISETLNIIQTQLQIIKITSIGCSEWIYVKEEQMYSIWVVNLTSNFAFCPHIATYLLSIFCN